MKTLVFTICAMMCVAGVAYGAVGDDALVHYGFDGGDLTNLAQPGTGINDLTGGDIGLVSFGAGVQGDALLLGGEQKVSASGFDPAMTMSHNTTSFWMNVNTGSAGKKVFEQYKSWLIYYSMRDDGNGYAIKAQWLEDAGWSVKNMWYSDDIQMLPTNAIPTVVPTGSWNMITFSADPIASGGTGQMKMYCNGVLIQTSPDDHPGFETDPAHIAVMPGRNIVTNPANPILGSDTAGSPSLDGGLDELYQWNRVLSDQEVMQHYLETMAIPEPSLGLLGLLLLGFLRRK
jgi:concanavalin A-like lectin/glucanase superfamily protein